MSVRILLLLVFFWCNSGFAMTYVCQARSVSSGRMSSFSFDIDQAEGRVATFMVEDVAFGFLVENFTEPDSTVSRWMTVSTGANFNIGRDHSYKAATTAAFPLGERIRFRTFTDASWFPSREAKVDCSAE